MSGSCCAPDAGPAVILVMAGPAPTGCLSSPLAELRNQVPNFGGFVTIATMAKSVCEVFHIVTLRGRHCARRVPAVETVLCPCAH
jgi:hypothetical protein